MADIIPFMTLSRQLNWELILEPSKCSAEYIAGMGDIIVTRKSMPFIYSHLFRLQDRLLCVGGGGWTSSLHIFRLSSAQRDTVSAFPPEVKPVDSLFNHRTNGRFFNECSKVP